MTEESRLSHRQTWELIPWVVNGTATPAQRQDVERHLRDCGDCRDEYALQTQFHTGINAGTTPAHDPQPALHRLLKRIDAAAVADDEAPPPAPRQRWVQLLAAAVVVQAIGLALLGGALLTRNVPSPAAEFRTLSSERPASVAAIRLVPAPTLSIAELKELLDEKQLRIVESGAGNTALGLALRPGVDRAAVDAIVADLRRRPGVLLAEPIVAPPASR